MNSSQSLLGIGLSVPLSKLLNLPSIIIHSLKTSHYLSAARSKKALHRLQGANLRIGDMQVANENFPTIRDDFAANEASLADVPIPL